MNLSEHFTLEELSTTSHSDLRARNRVYARENVSRLQALAKNVLEPCRAILGPMVITSGCRCPELNKRVGGNRRSQHCLCEAADFVPTKVPLELAFDLIRKSGIQYGQLILEMVAGTKWIHISLGEPYHPKARCNQALVYDGKKYKAV